MEDRELSLQFYHYVCCIVGSDEVVKARRKVFMALDYVLENIQQTFISSGSKAEGLDLEGSDYDLMIVDKNVSVYESIHDVSSSLHELTLVMDTTDTKPGFTKLKVYETSERYLPLLAKWCELFQLGSYVSNNLFRKYVLSQGDDELIVHGPCVTSKYKTFDLAYSFRCKKWVKPGKKWKFRSKSAWPDYELTQSIVQYGILFVPIGSKGSVDEDLEWRISFSVAERLLIYSFSHTQLVCYALLKILLKDFIKQEHYDLICSYFLKTIMFWLCEESSPIKWKPENLETCFMSCWRRLIYCVEYETCIHYFIPDNNLFEGRFSPIQHKSLLDTLYGIYRSPWNYVFHSITFENYRRVHENSFEPYLTTSSLTCLHYSVVLLKSISPSLSIKQVVTRTVNLQDKHLSTYLLSLLATGSMQNQDHQYLEGRNKDFYRQYQIMLRYFKTGVYSSSVHAWILLASLFYKCGRYRECIDIVIYSLSKCTPDKILMSLKNDIKLKACFKN
ncbi:protein mab-21-like [Mytilus californianus]|uniref:protein mab-21-like n=1 Tax=Mytilus californianus TaxID=6549 RepID=UPI002246A0AD|nr:protein mab-21-like [Mytilus californianus]